MTRNIKKLLVLVLVLAMSGSMMIVAWANTSDSDSETATIEFVGWAYPDGVHPPEVETETPPPGIDEEDMPEEPFAPDEGDDPDKLAGSGLQFWDHDITTLPTPGPITFHSVRALNIEGAFHADYEDPALADTEIDTDGHTSYAGMIFRFRESGWGVEVSMTEFTTEPGGDPAILGPELTLVRENTFGLGAFMPGVADNPIGERTQLSPALGATLVNDNDTDDLEMMWFGQNFSGELLLAGGLNDVAIVGDATADLTWTATPGTPSA